MPRVFRQKAARSDLIRHFVHLAEQAGEGTANRFLDNAEASFALLATQPKMGAPLTLRRADLAELRKWSVHDFEDFLVFYLPKTDGVTIVRVLHASSDWWGLLGLRP